MKRLPLLVSFLVAPVFAHVDNGTLKGAVREASGAAAARAPVTIAETQTNICFDVLTGAQRNYISPPLKAGIYPSGVSMPGFNAYTRTDRVVVTSEAVSAPGLQLKQNSEKRAESGGVAQ